jgi:SAM-dependent methyltransferase
MAKGRESGMPDPEYWETFFDPDCILSRLRCDGSRRNAAEFGCGYGTFTIPAARNVLGTVFSFDIEPEMVERTKARADAEGLTNIVANVRDFCANGTGLDDQSMDFVMLFNILHIEQSLELLREASRILSPNGVIGVIHWRSDISTPRGPSAEIRPSREKIRILGDSVGLDSSNQVDLNCCSWHWGLTMRHQEFRTNNPLQRSGEVRSLEVKKFSSPPAER